MKYTILAISLLFIFSCGESSSKAEPFKEQYLVCYRDGDKANTPVRIKHTKDSIISSELFSPDAVKFVKEDDAGNRLFQFKQTNLIDGKETEILISLTLHPIFKTFNISGSIPEISDEAIISSSGDCIDAEI